MGQPDLTEYRAFRRFVAGKRIPIGQSCILFGKSLLAIVEMSIRYIPGGFGYLLRYYYYRMFFKKVGKRVLIDAGVFLQGPRNMSIGDYVWIDTNCRIDARLGEVSIGNRVHISSSSLIFAREPVIIGDYVGISSYCRIYSSSEEPANGKRVSGPMVPEEMRSLRVRPIRIGKDCMIGTGGVLLPGAELGEGAVVGANTVVSRPVAPWTVVAGFPPRRVSVRSRVTVPDM